MKINTPFFVINPKNFLNLKEIINLAKYADQLAKDLNLTVFFTVPTIYLKSVIEVTENLIITAQAISVNPNRDIMGELTFYNITDYRIKAVVLNHDENPLTITQIINGIKKANSLNLFSIVCANSIQEAKMIATCNPTIILAEEADRIGGTEISNDSFLKEVIKEIKNINNNILVEYGAGIRTSEDVKKILSTGIDGVGVTSGIVKSSNPEETTEKMLNIVKIVKEEQ